LRARRLHLLPAFGSSGLFWEERIKLPKRLNIGV
jgi:hypothetical protein